MLPMEVMVETETQPGPAENLGSRDEAGAGDEKSRKHEDFIGFYSENHAELDGKHRDLSGKEWGLMMIYVLLVIACDS